MEQKTGEPPDRGGSNDFSNGELIDASRGIAAIVEVRDVATLDEGIEALVGGPA